MEQGNSRFQLRCKGILILAESIWAQVVSIAPHFFTSSGPHFFIISSDPHPHFWFPSSDPQLGGAKLGAWWELTGFVKYRMYQLMGLAVSIFLFGLQGVRLEAPNQQEIYKLAVFIDRKLRFGVAVSKCRTKFLKRHRRAAKQFLRRARKTPNDYDRRSKINRSWVNSANLQPVIDFLSEKWKIIRPNPKTFWTNLQIHVRHTWCVVMAFALLAESDSGLRTVDGG